MVERKELIDTVHRAIEPLNFVHALWLEGADAMGTVDNFSDIDIWIDADGGHDEDILQAIIASLKAHTPLKSRINQEHDHPHINQYFLRFEHTSPFHILDICIQDHKREFTFTKEYTDEIPLVLFDKTGVITFASWNPKEFKTFIEQRKHELLKSFRFFTPWREKGIKRQDFSEAYMYYYNYAIEPYLELIRIKYCPTKKYYGLKHLHRDLPSKEVERVEQLLKVTSLEDIEINLMMIETLIRKL